MTITAPADSGFRGVVAAALAEGWQVRSLYAAADRQSIRIALTAPDGRARIEMVPVSPDGAVPSIADLSPAMGWDEREAHDLYGIWFTGHEPMRPLLNHAAPLADWTVPVRGHDPYQVAVGPVHAGVIESGHFRFHVVGDRILHLDARLFYKHRGLERAAEGVTVTAALAIMSRACAACAVANGVAFATAAEQALGLRPSPQLARARTLLLELERVWNHLNDIAAVCAGTGIAAGNAWFLALTERARRLNASITGHRFLFGSVQVGRSELALDADAVSSYTRELAALRAGAETGWRELEFNGSFQNRLGGVGVVDARACTRLGVTGPAARAAGLAEDERTVSPYPGYDGFTPVTPLTPPAGDVRDRLGQRILELRQAFSLLDVLLDQGPLLPATAEAGDTPRFTGTGLAESPRGATSCIIEQNGGIVRRVRLRTASYANWPAVAHAAAGSLLPDFPLINKSFELCYACADR